ncbi:MAG TPA: hypothetical protein VIQ74_04625 [Gemmatimonadaceae bacterium]
MRELVARAPARIDFGGGWTDVPPYTTERGGCVCNLAIARHATVRLRSRDSGVVVDDGTALHSAASAAELVLAGESGLAGLALERAGIGAISLELRSDFPRGAGLGGSSAAGVALQAALAAWRGQSLEPAALAELSRATEVEGLRVAGGSQDHYAAAFGGALGLRFSESVAVRRLALAPAVRQAIEERCTVVFTGKSRLSGETISGVMDAYRARDPRVTSALDRMRDLAIQMIEALERGDLDDLAALVDEHWQHQRSLHPRITTPAIERVLAVARAAGALGGKALGASGGGSVLVIAPAERAAEVRDAVSATGEVLEFHVDEQGARTTGGRVQGSGGWNYELQRDQEAGIRDQELPWDGDPDPEGSF